MLLIVLGDRCAVPGTSILLLCCVLEHQHNPNKNKRKTPKSKQHNEALPCSESRCLAPELLDRCSSLPLRNACVEKYDNHQKGHASREPPKQQVKLHPVVLQTQLCTPHKRTPQRLGIAIQQSAQTQRATTAPPPSPPLVVQGNCPKAGAHDKQRGHKSNLVNLLRLDLTIEPVNSSPTGPNTRALWQNMQKQL